MEQFTIYCTEEQTQKAFKLGAPLQELARDFTANHDIPYTIINGIYYETPTAEQMIGWMETRGISDIRLMYYKGKFPYTWCYVIYPEGALENKQFHLIFEMDGFKSRRDATLGAIDEVLDYLEA